MLDIPTNRDYQNKFVPFLLIHGGRWLHWKMFMVSCWPTFDPLFRQVHVISCCCVLCVGICQYKSTTMYHRHTSISKSLSIAWPIFLMDETMILCMVRSANMSNNIHICIFLFIYIYIYMYIMCVWVLFDTILYIYTYIHTHFLFIHGSILSFVFLSIYLSIYRSIYRFISIYASICFFYCYIYIYTHVCHIHIHVQLLFSGRSSTGAWRSQPLRGACPHGWGGSAKRNRGRFVNRLAHHYV